MHCLILKLLPLSQKIPLTFGANQWQQGPSPLYWVWKKPPKCIPTRLPHLDFRRNRDISLAHSKGFSSLSNCCRYEHLYSKVRCFLSISSELSSHHFCFLHLHGLRNRISLINSFRDSFHGYRVGFWEHKKCSERCSQLSKEAPSCFRAGHNGAAACQIQNSNQLSFMHVGLVS